MPLADLTGRAYGPTVYRIDPEKVLDFIDATGDDRTTWSSCAPPSFAGALLFAITPELLADPDLATHTHGVIHGDQTFTWHRPLNYGLEVEVLGEVTKLRERGGIAFLGFALTVSDGDGVLVNGNSTFLLSGEASAAGDHPEESEPGPDDGGGQANPGSRIASRRDLVKYAGASRDFNPIHWDHDAAVGAGLPGVVVHGLLQSAWMLQTVDGTAGAPIASVRFRYRNPLRPGVRVELRVTDGGGDTLDVALADSVTEYVTARIERKP